MFPSSFMICNITNKLNLFKKLTTLNKKKILKNLFHLSSLVYLFLLLNTRDYNNYW